MSVRHAVAEDLNTVLDLRRERPYAALPIRGQTTEQRRQAVMHSIEVNWRHLGTEPRLQMLVNDNSNGFLVMFTGLQESISGDSQAVIQDLHGRSPEDVTALLKEAEWRTLASGGDFSVIELAVGETALEEHLAQSGYAVEMLRILKSVHANPTRTPRFSVRPARRTDHLFMCWLSEHTAFNTMVPGRSGDPEDVALRFFASYASQSFIDDSRMRAFIAEDLSDPDEPKQIGYILLKLGFQDLVDRQRLAYIYDISVHPDYMGRRVFYDLMDQAERFMVANRVTLLQGDISMTNTRALRAAVKSLGFQVEWQRWAKKLK